MKWYATIWTIASPRTRSTTGRRGSVAAGHCRPEIAEAVYRQLKTLDYAGSFLRAHPKAFELAARITQYTPAPLNRVFFVNSGSEAVDTAMKIALLYHRVRGQPQRQI